jgi:hypothetical protein
VAAHQDLSIALFMLLQVLSVSPDAIRQDAQGLSDCSISDEPESMDLGLILPGGCLIVIFPTIQAGM